MTNLGPISKFQRIRLGPGGITNLTGECEVWCDTAAPSGGKDGDLWIYTNTGHPQVYQRVGGNWVALSSNLDYTQVSLTDGQVGSTAAFSYSAAQFPFARITYTIKRGSGETTKQQGEIVVLSDSLSNTFQTSQTLTEFGADVQVPLTISMSGGNVSVNYTSANLGVSITLRYNIAGW